MKYLLEERQRSSTKSRLNIATIAITLLLLTAATQKKQQLRWPGHSFFYKKLKEYWPHRQHQPVHIYF